ncbi:MAG TPA: TonB-dependent receptor plug domain-containing protein, partial [Bacteroidales bacterium]|nr:TonB-dependent receptor plug domain-containing protein [Bacteroidales bacterium]
MGFAQTKKITGTVYNSAKEPLVAASVVEMKVQYDSDELKNANYTPTTNGTFTLGDGTFELEVTENQSAIEISYIGYKPLIVPITTISTYSIVLQPDAISIQTVVVTVPYSKQKKETYTGSLSTVSSATLSNSTESSFDKALQGQVPGVVLSTASGQPGASSQIQLRGTGSISAGSEPLIVIDGVVMYSGETTQAGSGSSILSSINPNDIESISVLKDASATSLYGSRGSNGVIMITTKQGKKDKSAYTYSTTQGVGMLAMNNFELLTADQYKQLQTEGMKQAGMAQEDIAAALQQQTGNTNWFDEVYDNWVAGISNAF